jgi:glutaredoxin
MPTPDRASVHKVRLLQGAPVLVVGLTSCPWCRKATQLLKKHKVNHEWRVPADDFAFDTVPQIWVDGEHIGGYAELSSLFPKVR